LEGLAILTIPTPQPPGHGAIAGVVAVSRPNPRLEFVPQLPPLPEKHETKRPETKGPELARESYRSPLLEPISLPIDIALRQLPVAPLPEFDAAPHKTTMPTAPASPSWVIVR
jgi:hypothetical protein